jgi:hypothetical protein
MQPKVKIMLCKGKNKVIMRLSLSRAGGFMNDIEKAKAEDLKILDGFCLLDDFFMTVVFDQNIGATEFVLNIILGRDDLEVIEVVAQRDYKNPIPGGRSIRLDIYAKDSEGKVYDIEVQNENAGADVHRARFHSSMLDTKMLKEKQKFREIHDSYVIFITKSDYMKMGLPMYHVERTVRETGALFGDGSHIIYMNGSYKDDSDPVGKLMHDFRCTSSEDMFYRELAKPVAYFKETEGGRSQLCKTMEERIDKERIETLFDVVKNLMETMKMTAEQAMVTLKISDADRAALSRRF